MRLCALNSPSHHSPTTAGPELPRGAQLRGKINSVTASLLAALYAVVLATAFAAGIRPLPTLQQRRWPWATTVGLLIIGLPTLAQFTVAPSLLQGLERNWTLIGQGQVWRLLTSLVVQDGGIAGAIFNLVALAMIGFAAEKAWGAKRWIVIAVTGALGAQLWGKVVQPIGGGNSVMVFSLAASIAVLAVLRGAAVQRILGLISLVGAVVLLIIGDIHGAAAAIGAVLGAVFATSHVLDGARQSSGP
jgi:membrane associated rhomboid family serine protease